MQSYNDEAPAQSAPPPAAEPEPSAAPSATAVKEEPTSIQQEDYNDHKQTNEGDGGDDSNMHGADEYEDDDDDVDFNLGNGGGGSHAPDNDSYDNSQSGPAHNNRANSKEEG